MVTTRHSRLVPSSARPTICASTSRGSGVSGFAPMVQRHMVGDDLLIFRRESLEQLVAKLARELPAGDGRTCHGGSNPAAAIQFLCCELPDQIGGEFAQRIVARAHDQDPVAVARLGDQPLADGRALGDMFGVALRSADPLGQPVGPAALVDRAALIDRVGQIEPVVGRHAVGEAGGQLLAHLGDRAEAVRLEHDQQPPRLRAQRRQRRVDLVGIVREIVDDGDAGRGADSLEPPPEPLEAAPAPTPPRRRRRRPPRRQRSRPSAFDTLCRPGTLIRTSWRSSGMVDREARRRR